MDLMIYYVEVSIAGNMAGGTHHAFRGEGAGYCIFNDWRFVRK